MSNMLYSLSNMWVDDLHMFVGFGEKDDLRIFPLWLEIFDE